jgi:hypothetical protein
MIQAETSEVLMLRGKVEEIEIETVQCEKNMHTSKERKRREKSVIAFSIRVFMWVHLNAVKVIVSTMYIQ